MGKLIYGDFYRTHDDEECSLESPCQACRREIEAEIAEVEAELENAQVEDEG